MRKGSKRLDALKMCDDCRVAAVTEDEFDPHGAPARPNVRTTDDYLRERADTYRRRTRAMTADGPCYLVAFFQKLHSAPRDLRRN